MNDLSKANQELLEEISSLKKRIQELEKSDAEHKQEEKTLKENNDKFLNLASTIPGNIAYVNANTLQYEFVNDTFEKSFGIPREKIIGQHIKDVIGEANYKFAMKYIEEVRLGKSISYENTFALVSGKRWIQVNYTPVIDAKGLVTSIAVLSLDITERKKADEALKAAEETYRNIFLNAQTGLFRTAINTGLILDVNDCVARFIGYRDREELLSKPFNIAERYVDPKDRERMISLLREHGHFSNFEARFRRNDDSIMWMRFAGRIVSEKGWIEGVSEDITKEKDAEEALIQAEENFRRSLDESPLGVRIVTEEGKTVYANRAILDMHDYDSIEEYKITPTEKRYTPECFAEHQTRKEKRKRGDDLLSEYEISIVRKTGEVRHLQVLRKEIQWDGKRQFQVICQDITDRKRAEETLRRNEKDLKESQRIAHVGSWRLDVATNKVVWTEELYNMYGFDPSLPPPPYAEHMKLFTPESWDRLSKALARTRDTGIPYTLELETVRKDGSNGWMWVHGQADVDSTGKTVGFWGAAQDITERKRAEEENRLLQERLNRSEKMESLGMLAGGVAHDLNNVLGVVLGYSELLASSLDTSSPLQSRVEKIMKGTERAAEIVQDLLTLARRGVQTRSPVRINDIIMNFLKSPEYERILLCNPRMRVNADLQADILNMMGSKIHLHKTIMNLVSNASDAMPDGGCLNIKTSNQYLDRAISGYDHVHEGDYVVLSVSDTGEGISSDDIRHIFEPFYTKKVMGRSGTGLGLAVVWGTVKDHEGYIDVQSEVGKGTTFDLYFPVTREKVSDEKIPVSLSDYMGKGESVLVIDDVKGQCDLASEMLSRLNYKVASVPSGEAAVEYLKANRADILVLDMIMDPGMDGLDMYKEILELYPGQKAVIVSGFSETDRVKKAHRLGAGAYVRKPYALERLGLAVRRELDKK